jgi:cell wall-associated NlpC family hydrolase
MAVAAQTATQFAMPIGPNTIRATTKWSGGNGADLFARAGEPIYAIADGYLQAYHGVHGPFGEVPSGLLQTSQGVSAQYTHVVITTQGQVHRGDRIGYVSDPQLNALGAYPGMPDNFQHLDLTMGYGSGPFPITGGQINVNSWLEQNGYGGRVFQGQSRGPNGAGGGGSTFGNLSQIFNPFGNMFGGQGGANVGGNVGGNYGLLGLQNQQLGPTFDNGDGGSTAFQSGDTGVIPVSATDVLSQLTSGSGSNNTLQLSNRIDFQNPFEGIPEEWADMIPFLLAALIVAVGVGLIEHGEEHGGTKSPAIWLAILVILGVFLFRQAKSGGTVADAVVEAINSFAPAVQNQLSLANNTSTTAGPGTLTQPLTGNRVSMPSVINGVQNVASRALGVALGQRGQPYVWAGASPTAGFDCSGLVQWAYAQAGVNLPRTAQTQFNATRRVSQSEARPGDLVFFEHTDPSQSDRITHVGIYMGNGQMLDAPQPGSKVDVRPVSSVRNLVGYGRVGQ